MATRYWEKLRVFGKEEEHLHLIHKGKMMIGCDWCWVWVNVQEFIYEMWKCKIIFIKRFIQKNRGIEYFLRIYSRISDLLQSDWKVRVHEPAAPHSFPCLLLYMWLYFHEKRTQCCHLPCYNVISPQTIELCVCFFSLSLIKGDLSKASVCTVDDYIKCTQVQTQAHS